MTNLLFADYESDDRTFKACVEFWSEMIKAISQRIEGGREWERWIPLTYGDRATLFEDRGNPIFDGRSDDLGRAFRIIQHPRVPQEEFSAWIKPHDWKGFPRKELFIDLCLTTDTAELARHLLEAWLDPKKTPDEVEKLVAEIGIR